MRVDKQTAKTLNQRLLQNLKARTTDQASYELQMPADAFFCEQRFALEREKLFLQVPQPVAFSAEIPEPGSYFTLDVLDIPIVLTRSESGQLNAFLNACSHRGAKVADGHGQKSRMVCRFHGWAYSLEGQLTGRPGEEYFSNSKHDCALTRLPVSEKYGIVVVGIDPICTQASVDNALKEVGEELGNFQFEQYQAIDRRHYTVNANWKLVTDLSLESYHFNTLHRDSVASMLASNAIVDTYEKHSRWAFPLKSIARLAKLSETEWPDAIEGSCTYTLYPGVMIIVNASGAQMIRAEPGSVPGESRVIYSGICGLTCTMEDAVQAYGFGGDVFEKEDLPMAEECQRGLESSKRDLLLGKNEPLLQFWHRLWNDALR
jgi:phenylpropionate dioxygenase-like ring-hydroxylating dioxygenase large terminal subunit